MASDLCTRRLTKELAALRKDPISSPKITVAPNEANILEMHYVIEGSAKTPYEGGIYHGKLVFPKEYPLKPPSVMMMTPSGRFHPNRRLCLSMVRSGSTSQFLMFCTTFSLTLFFYSSLTSTQNLGTQCGLLVLF